MKKTLINAFLCILTILSSTELAAQNQQAFGGPGIQPNWSSAKKVVAVSAFEDTQDIKSPVYLTAAHGILTEVFFPTVDKGQIKDSQLLVVTDKGEFLQERTDFTHRVVHLDSALVTLENTHAASGLKISHTLFPHPNKSWVIDRVRVEVPRSGFRFYLLTNPQLDNTGYHDSAWVTPTGFYVQDGATSMQLLTTVPMRKKSVGFVGFSDGYQDLVSDQTMNFEFQQALGGNVALTGELDLSDKRGVYEFFVVYQFSMGAKGREVERVSGDELLKAQQDFQAGWNKYLKSLPAPKFRNAQEEKLYWRSLVTIKSHEDKLNPGALVASLSIPWGEKQFETQGHKIGGYHLIWPRDLYHVALSMLLAGDKKVPLNALRYLAQIQYKKQDGVWNYHPRVIPKEGAFPQNTWVNGEEYWSGLQIDQVGQPVLLFFQLYKRLSPQEQQSLLREFQPMVTKALDFIQNYGPWSAQERWEENFGISPNSFAAATAALMVGGEVFKGTAKGEGYFRTANSWLNKPGDNIDTWTFTYNGVHGSGGYYLRVGGCARFDSAWDPYTSEDCHVANSHLRVATSDFIDQGFLDLALLGLKAANDEKILSSLKLVNQKIKVTTPTGTGWYRYLHDAYGEDGKGRLWPLLGGEHGRFALELFKTGSIAEDSAMNQVNQVMNSFIGFANDGLMIPEQIFENDGLGTGAATPLAWSHAEYIKLIWSRHEKKNLVNPF